MGDDDDFGFIPEPPDDVQTAYGLISATAGTIVMPDGEEGVAWEILYQRETDAPPGKIVFSLPASVAEQLAEYLLERARLLQRPRTSH